MALEFIGQPLGETRVFDDTLTKCHPYVAEKPRNHDSLFYVTAGALRYTCGETCAVIPQGGVGYIGKGAADTSAADGDAVSGFGAPRFQYFTQKDISMIYYNDILRIRDLLRGKVASASGETRMHYQYLLHNLDKALNK